MSKTVIILALFITVMSVLFVAGLVGFAALISKIERDWAEFEKELQKDETGRKDTRK